MNAPTFYPGGMAGGVPLFNRANMRYVLLSNARQARAASARCEANGNAAMARFHERAARAYENEAETVTAPDTARSTDARTNAKAWRRGR